MVPIRLKGSGFLSFFFLVCGIAVIFRLASPALVGAIELSPDEHEYLHKKETIVFVSQTRYPPFEFINALGQQEGIMHDIVHWISMEAGFKPVFLDMTFQQAQEEVLEGRADILTSLFYSDKRNERFEFTQPFFDVPASMFVRAERTDIKELKDLNGKIIAIQRGDYAKDYLESQKIMFQTLDTNDFAEATDRVIVGKADAVIGDEQIVYYHLFSNRLTDYVKTVGEPLYIGKNCMASRKGNAVLIGILNKGLLEAGKSGALEKIVKKWLGTKYSPRKSFLEIYLWPIGLAAGIILLLSVGGWIWNARLRSLVRQKTEIILRREASLRASEENFRAFFNNNPALMAVSNSSDRKITDVNEAFLKTLGFSREEVIGKTSAQLDLFVHPEKHLELSKQLQAQGRILNCELQIKCKDGRILDGLFSGELIESRGGKNFLTVMIDQTIRKQVEEEVRRSRAELDEIFCMSLDGICIADIHTATFLKVNPAFTRILGYSETELLQRPFLDCIHPDDVAPTMAVIQEKLRRGQKVINFTNRYRCADGTYRWLEWVSHPSIERGITFAVAHDITERKIVEKKQAELQEQNRRLQKAESLGRMAAAIAHHFNNMLGGIMGNIELALSERPEEDGYRKKLSEAMKAARKAAELSGLMLTYIGQTSSKFEQIDLTETCRNHLPMLQAGMPSDLILETDLPSPSPLIRGNTGQIKQVLTQLFNNAREAMADGRGLIRLCIRTVSAIDIPTMNRFPIGWQPQEKRYACLEVMDNGCGIAPKDIENLFDPFFSRKLIGRGLGLAVILGIVRMHRGVVVVTSLLGQGSIFQAYLPVSEETAVCGREPVDLSREFKGEGLVLLVEDEEVLREVAANMLAHLGFTVIQAKDGVEAVELFQQHQTEIRLALCDLTMPRMNGWETLAALRGLSSDIPVILASGYDESSAMQGAGPEQSFQAFLHKPFVLAELAVAVRQALGQIGILDESARQPEKS